ncbi:MAG: hypothetical protein IKB51_06670 [Clostridia bacterium]|nr:hypothetical protein [Clostridia bacterium]
MKTTKKISLAAILAALAFIILLIGCVLETVTFSVPAIASLVVIVAVVELGYTYAVLLYASVSVLAFLLLPVKDPLLYFAGFFGYYPILKSVVEKIKIKPLSYVSKGVIFSAAYALVAFIGIKFFAPEADLIKAVLIAYPIFTVVFYIFDFALTKLISYYCRSLRKRLKIDDLLK